MVHIPTSSPFHPRPVRSGLFTPRAAQAPLRPRYIHAEADRPTLRWPLGIGLMIAAFFSLAIWAGLVFGALTLLGG